MRKRTLLATILAAGCGSGSGDVPLPPDASDSGAVDGSVDGDAGKLDSGDAGADGTVDSRDGTVDSRDGVGEEQDGASDTREDVSDEARDASGEDVAAEPDEGGDASDATGEDVSTCRSWTYWKEGLTGGNIDQVAFDPRVRGRAYGTASGQFYRSNNGGGSWTVVSNDTGVTIADLVFPPGDAQVLLAATSDGLRRSEDGGQTWSIRSLQGIGLTSLLVDGASPQRIFVGGDQGLLMRSTDGGTTWRAASSGLPFGQVTSMVGDPTNSDNIVASVILEDSTGAWVTKGAVVQSTNGGISWSTVLSVDGFAWGVSQCPADPKVLYASTVQGIGKSVDGGASWAPLQLSGTDANDIGIDPTDCNHVYAAIFPSGMAKSSNGGATWSAPTTNGLTLQDGFQYATRLSVDPNDGGSVLAATHGGIYRSSNGGDLWSAAPGIEGVLCRDLRVSATAPQQLWMASWGSGAWRRTSPTASWERIPLDKLPREWLFTVHPDNFVGGRLLVGAFLGGNDAWRSTDNGATFAPTNAQALNPFVFATDPSNSSVMYMGTQLSGVLKSTDGGATWSPSNTGAETAFVLSILIDSADGQIIYIGTQDRGILRSANAGASWSPTTMGLGVGGIGSMVRFGTSLYAWVHGAGVYRSQDGVNWVPSNTGLDSLTAGGIIVDTTRSRMFVVAGAGVYTSSDGTTWQAFDKGCPPPTGGSTPVIVGEGASRFIVLNAGSNGVLAHPL